MTRHQRLELRPRLFAPVLRLQKGVSGLGHDQVDVRTGCKESGRNLGCLHRGDGARYTKADTTCVFHAPGFRRRTRRRQLGALVFLAERCATSVPPFFSIND